MDTPEPSPVKPQEGLDVRERRMNVQDLLDQKGCMASYRALDLTDEKGFLCGAILGGLGMDVIKIEPPGGEPTRNIGPFYKDILQKTGGESGLCH